MFFLNMFVTNPGILHIFRFKINNLDISKLCGNREKLQLKSLNIFVVPPKNKEIKMGIEIEPYFYFYLV